MLWIRDGIISNRLLIFYTGFTMKKQDVKYRSFI